MESERIIHIINLNHFLESNKLAQYCLENNRVKEPKMNFKIWTEDDLEIQEGIKSCHYKNAFIAPCNMAGIYLPYYIVHRFGGMYCEMDYEFLQDNYFYNLTQKTDFALEAAGNENLSINNGKFVYSKYPENEFLSIGLKLFNSKLATYNDWETLQFSNVLKLNLISKKQLDNLKKQNLELWNSTFLKPPILHYCGINYEKNIYVCNLNTYNWLCKTENYHKKEQKTIVYVDRSLYPDKVDMTKIDWYNQQVFYDLPLIKHYVEIVRKYTDKTVYVLDNVLG